MAGCAIFCLSFIAFAVVMQLVKPGRGSLVVVLLSIVLFGTGFVCSLNVVRSSNNRIAVNPVGIWYLEPIRK